MVEKTDSVESGWLSHAAKVGMTLNYVIDFSRAQYGDLPAIGMALSRSLSYNDLHDRILALAALMRKDGVEKGDRIGILAENSQHWGTVYFAAVRLGAVVVPILPDHPEDDVHHILHEMGVKVLFTTQLQIEKLYEYKQSNLTKVITLDDYHCLLGIVKTSTFSRYIKKAVEQWASSDQKSVEFDNVHEDDLASIIYTSGTSGYPKAVMLTHKNLTANAYSASGLISLPPTSVFLSILPLSHIYEFTCGFLLPLIKGGHVVYAGKTPTPVILKELCRKEKPYAIFVVPLILEKVYKKRILPEIKKNKLVSNLCRTKMGLRYVYRKLGKELLEFFGGRLEIMGIGGDCLNSEVEYFLTEAKIPYIVGYGLTEAAPLLSGGPMGDKTIGMGSCGKPISNVELKIVNADAETGIGEIYACGPNIMKGYYQDQLATEEVLSKDGWLATGDLGLIDEDGNLRVYGRVENRIILKDGSSISPESIERKMNALYWVVESLVIENNNQFDAWVYPDYEWIDEKTAGWTQIERHKYIQKLLWQLRMEINDQFPENCRLLNIFERREPFKKTTTQKIKRYLYNSQTMNNPNEEYLFFKE